MALMDYEEYPGPEYKFELLEYIDVLCYCRIGDECRHCKDYLAYMEAKRAGDAEMEKAVTLMKSGQIRVTNTWVPQVGMPIINTPPRGKLGSIW